MAKLNPLLAAWLGFFIVSYDGALAAVVLAPAFSYFIAGDASPVLVGALLLSVFNASRLGRPFGALIFGRMVDRGEHVRAAVISAGGYAVLSIVMGLLPGHAATGYLGLGLLLALRAVSGVFLAGQSVTFGPGLIHETARERRWLVGALIPTGSPVSYIFASLLTLLVLQLFPVGGADSRYAVYGWRIAVMTGALAGAVSLVLALGVRRAMPPSPPPGPAARPAGPDRAGQRRLFLAVLLLLSGVQIVLSTAVASLPGFLIQVKQQDAATITRAVLAAYCLLTLAYPMAGWLSARLGVTRVFVGWAVVATVLGVGALQALNALPPGQGTPVAVTGLMLVTVASLSVAGFMHTYSIEAFPRHILATGYGVARSLSELVPVFSGLYLLLLSLLVGGAAAPAALLGIGGCLVIAGAAAASRASELSLQQSKDVS